MPTFSGELINTATGVASLDDTKLRGGRQTVTNVTTRDAINGGDFEKEGMTVFVTDDDVAYQWSGSAWLETIKYTATSAVINESGADVDFRVEAVGKTNALFVRGSDGNVGIGTDSPSSLLTVSEGIAVVSHAGTGNSADLILVTHNDQATHPSVLDFRKSNTDTLGGNVATVAGNYLGDILFRGNNGSNFGLTGASIKAIQDGPFGASRPPTYLSFSTSDGSSLTEAMRITSGSDIKIPVDGVNLSIGVGDDLSLTHNGSNSIIANATGDLQINGAAGSEVVLNESGADVDFRAETVGQPNALFVRGSDGNVGIGTTTPDANLHVSADGNAVSSSLFTSDRVLLSEQGGAAGFNIVVASSDHSLHRGVYKATRSRGTLAIPTVPSADDSVFSFLGAIFDGTNTEATASIDMFVDGAVSSDVAPGRISFSTSETTANARTERVVIKSDGNVNIPTDGVNFSIGAGDDLTLQHNGTNSIIANATGDLQINGAAGSEVVFNESGADVDFRAETVGQPNALFVRGSDGKVGIGNTSPLSTLDVEGSFAAAINTVTGVTLNDSHHFLVVDTTAAIRTVILPAASTAPRRGYFIRNDGTAGNDVTIDADGTETINGALTLTLSDGQTAHIVCDGTEWFSF